VPTFAPLAATKDLCFDATDAEAVVECWTKALGLARHPKLSCLTGPTSSAPGGRSTRWTSSRVPGAKTGQELLRIQRLRRINGDTPGDVFDSAAAAT